MTETKFSSTLRELCAIPGISGQEYMVAREIKGRLEKMGAAVYADNMGNVAAHIKGKGSAASLMFIAHMDEVGAIVSEISENGLILFRTVGGVDSASLASLRVLVDGHPGAISAPPAHMAAGQPQGRLHIDVGACCRQEVLDMGINIGSMITFDTPYTPLHGNRVCGHAIDDRVGCAMLLELFGELDFVPDGDIYLGFSVREETVMSGAAMLVERYKPDYVIAVDTVPMRMGPGGNPLIDLGKGPVYQLAEGLMSAFAGNFVHPGIKEALIRAAEAVNAPYQLCAEIGDWTTDGNTISRANGGTPSGYISIPRRCAHSASEIMDLRDPIEGIRIMKALVRDMKNVKLNLV